jgi:hypothetical protein
MKFILYSCILLLLIFSLEVQGVEKKLRASLKRRHPVNHQHRLSRNSHGEQVTSSNLKMYLQKSSSTHTTKFQNQ